MEDELSVAIHVAIRDQTDQTTHSQTALEALLNRLPPFGIHLRLAFPHVKILRLLLRFIADREHHKVEQNCDYMGDLLSEFGTEKFFESWKVLFELKPFLAAFSVGCCVHEEQLKLVLRARSDFRADTNTIALARAVLLGAVELTNSLLDAGSALYDDYHEVNALHGLIHNGDKSGALRNALSRHKNVRIAVKHVTEIETLHADQCTTLSLWCEQIYDYPELYDENTHNLIVWILSQGADPSECDAFYWACCSGIVPLMKALWPFYSKPMERCMFEGPVCSGNPEAIEWLHNRAGFLPDSLLFTAVENEKIQLLPTIFKLNPKTIECMNQDSLLVFALRRGQLACLSWLIGAGALALCHPDSFSVLERVVLMKTVRKCYRKICCLHIGRILAKMVADMAVGQWSNAWEVLHRKAKRQRPEK
jgi:hypothetical protein